MEVDWDELMELADEISSENLSKASKECYNSRIRSYEKVMTSLDKDAYPIDIDKMKGFIMFQYKNKNRKFNTLIGYITGFSNYFQQNNLPNLTKDITFKNFKSGLRRRLLGSFCPKAKLPFEIGCFEAISTEFPLNQLDNRVFFYIYDFVFYRVCKNFRTTQFKKKKRNSNF